MNRKIKLFTIISLLCALPAISFSEDAYKSLSEESFSAVELSQVLKKSDSCKTKNTSQVVVAVNMGEFIASKDVKVALSNGKSWTKRGLLKPISKDVAVTLSGSTVENIEKNNTLFAQKNLMGAYFYDVPVDQELTLYIYSEELNTQNGNVGYKFKALSGPEPCSSVMLSVLSLKSNSKDMEVCVHSKEKTKNYEPKKTFLTPSQNEEIKKYQSTNKNTSTSLGPCQSTESVTANISSGLEPSGQKSNASSAINSVNPQNIPNAQIQGDSTVALARLNNFRKSIGKSEFIIDAKLQDFAEFRAKNLSTYTYSGIDEAHGHPDIQNDLREKNIDCAEETSISTVPAWEELAEELINSQSHRQGLADSSGRIGITTGTLKDGYILVVELSK